MKNSFRCRSGARIVVGGQLTGGRPRLGRSVVTSRVVLEAAGLPLDASFAEQKRIFQRCGGLFYRCNGGAEARRFNRLLIDAGLIKGMVSR
jgi:hypothetical protein